MGLQCCVCVGLLYTTTGVCSLTDTWTLGLIVEIVYFFFKFGISICP